MKTMLRSSLGLGAFLGALLILNAQEATPAPASPPVSGERSALATLTAQVMAINQATREVTLKGPLGNDVSFIVDQQVQRLDEVSVGDQVTVDYLVSLAGEVRAPTAEEKATPYLVVADAGRAPAGTLPAAGVLRGFRVVATVVSLNLATQTVTLQGPKGNTGDIRVANLDKLKQVHVGDTVIVTYTEALAVSLQKAPAAPAAK